MSALRFLSEHLWKFFASFADQVVTAVPLTGMTRTRGSSFLGRLEHLAHRRMEARPLSACGDRCALRALLWGAAWP